MSSTKKQPLTIKRLISRVNNNFINKFSNPLVMIVLAATISLTPLVFIASHSVYAAGDANFSLSPSGGSYTVGNSLVVSVSETSSSSDNTDAVQVNLTYPSSLLQYVSTALTGPFSLCGQNSGGSGSINIGCASSATQSGNQPIAQVTFDVLSAGTANVNMTSGSNIVNSSGSVWNGVLPSASYTLSSVTTTSPPPTTTTPSPSGSGSGSASGSGNNSSKSTAGSSGGSNKPSVTNDSTSGEGTTPSATTNSTNAATNAIKKGSVINPSSKVSTKKQLSSVKLTSYIAIPIGVLVLAGLFLIYKGYRLTLIAEKPFIKLYKKAEQEIEKEINKIIE